MQRTVLAMLVGGIVFLTGQGAAAQSMLDKPWNDRVFAGISFGLAAGSTQISDTRTFTIYQEQGTLSSNTGFDSDSIFDVTVGAKVWRNMGVALAYHAESTTGAGDIQGTVPHPLFFDRPRSFTKPVDGIDRDESAVHLQVGWMFPIDEKFDVFVYGGPSFFGLKQDVVVITVAEAGAPFTNVIAETTEVQRKENATGFNIGADATYILYTRDTLRLGLGGFFRYTSATATIEASQGNFIDTDLGGAQFGIGARIRF